jgi:hypothetical protein
MRYQYRPRLRAHAAMPFTGLATYDDFTVLDADISEILLLVAVRETPFLDLLGTPLRPATNVKHDWVEQNIGPDRIIASTAINSATAATGVQVNGLAHLLQVGMLLEVEAPAGSNTEIAQISSIPGPNSLLLTRNVGVTPRGVSSLAAGGTLFVISTAEKEGDDTDGDVSRPRVPKTNYTQIFKKPVKLSGTRQAVLTAPNVGSELENQVALRTIELLRDLEKAVIRSVAISTIGDDNVYRSMDGLRQFITTINSGVAGSSFTADPLKYVNAVMAQAWGQGARDLDVLLVGSDWGADISATNASKFVVEQGDRTVQRLVERITTDYGSLVKVVSPWMPPKSMMGVSTRRIFVPPLTGRNFQRQNLAKVGDNDKLHVIGEYTLEVHHPEQMFQSYANA